MKMPSTTYEASNSTALDAPTHCDVARPLKDTLNSLTNLAISHASIEHDDRLEASNILVMDAKGFHKRPHRLAPASITECIGPTIFADRETTQNDLASAAHTSVSRQLFGPVKTSHGRLDTADPMLRSDIKSSMNRLYTRVRDNVEVLVGMGARGIIRYHFPSNKIFGDVSRSMFPGDDFPTIMMQLEHVHGVLGMTTTEIVRSFVAVAVTQWSLHEVIVYRRQMELICAFQVALHSNTAAGKKLSP